MDKIEGYKLIGFWDPFGVFGVTDFFGLPIYEKDDKLYFAKYNDPNVKTPIFAKQILKEKIICFEELSFEEEDKPNFKTFDSVKCINLIGEDMKKIFFVGDDYLYSFVLKNESVILANTKKLYSFLKNKGYSLVDKKNHDILDHFINKVDESNLWPTDKNMTRTLKLDNSSNK